MEETKKIEIADKDMKAFRKGLRVIVSERFATQRDFANKIDIDAVSLSKIFTGKTSRPRQETLLKIFDVLRVGVGEIIDRGKTDGDTDVDLSALSGDQMIDYVNNVLSDCKEVLREVIKQAEIALTMVAKERNVQYAHVQRKKAILNALGDRVKSVNSDMQIKYCNQAYRANKGHGVGETCRDEGCEGHNCAAAQVFATGQPVSDIVHRGGRWLGVNAYPMVSMSGEVYEVVVSTRDVTEFHEKALRGEVS